MIRTEDEQDKQLLLTACDIILKAGGISAINVANRLLLSLQVPAPEPTPEPPVEDPTV